MLAAVGTTKRPPIQNNKLQGGGKRRCYNEMKPKTTHVFKNEIGESQLVFLSLGGAWFCPNLASLDQGAAFLALSSLLFLFSFWLAAASSQEARGGWPGRLCGSCGRFMGALPGLPEESSPRSTACWALWGRFLLSLSSMRTDWLFLLPDSST